MRVAQVRARFGERARGEAFDEEQERARREAERAAKIRRNEAKSTRAIELAQRFNAMTGPLHDLAIAVRGRLGAVGCDPAVQEKEAASPYTYTSQLITLERAEYPRRGPGRLVAAILTVMEGHDVSPRGVIVKAGFRGDDAWDTEWDKTETYVDQRGNAGKKGVNLQRVSPWMAVDTVSSLYGDDISPRVLRRTSAALDRLHPVCAETTEVLWDAARDSRLNPDIAEHIGPYISRYHDRLPYAAAIMQHGFVVTPEDLTIPRRPSL